MSQEIMNTLVVLLGGLLLILLPTIAGIAWKSAANIVTALNALTVTVAKIEVKLDNVTTHEIPALKEDIRSRLTQRQDRNNNKDQI